MRPSPFHYVVISYFTTLTVTAQEASKGLSASHTGCWVVGAGEAWLTDRSPCPHQQCPCPCQSQRRRGGGLSLETEKEIQKQEANEGPLTRLNMSSDQNWAGREELPHPQQAPLHVLKYKQSWPRGIVEIAIINSDGAPGGASFSIIVTGLVSHSSNRISKVQVLPPGAPLETHYFKAPQ